VRREIVRFAVPGVVGMVLLALVSLAVSVAIARDQSLRDAENTARWLARAVVSPLLDEQLGRGSPARVSQLDTAFATSVRGSDVVAVRLWNSDGVMVYSDDPRLMGERFPVPQGSPTGSLAEDADLSRPENRYLDPDRETVQVNLPITGQDGSRYLFQISQLRNTIQSDAQRVWVAFAPVVVGSLVVLAVLLLVLAVQMARRISADLRAREELLQQAVDASDLERRRIAADLHDGTVQDIAGLSYTLAGLSRRARRAGDDSGAQLLSEAARQSQESVRELRSLLVDIYPPNLSAAGLSAALSDQLSALEPTCRVTADLAELADLDEALTAVLYRIAREALTNVAKHAAATQAQLTLRQDGRQLRLRVADNGRGFDPAADPGEHLGLRLIRDLGESAGGTLTIDSAPGRGTVVEFLVERP
jgi:signal transduction histidine kinase